jgi:anti-sigma factor ChrR (cupin superfamily)
MSPINPSNSDVTDTVLAALLMCEEDLVDEAHPVLNLLVEDLPPVAPRPAARARLLGAARTSRHVHLLATLFDVVASTAKAYLDQLTDASLWDVLMPGIQLMHLQGGPRTAEADVGFVKVAADLDFPPHTHGGEERNLVLSGNLTEADGTVLGAGDVFTRPAGTRHVFRTGPDGLTFAVVARGVVFDNPDTTV